MKWVALMLFFIVGAVLVGCNSGTISEDENRAMAKEFSQENYEKNMKAMGKGKELEEEKRKNEEYLRGGQ